mgnify:CR=1 FL=1
MLLKDPGRYEEVAEFLQVMLNAIIGRVAQAARPLTLTFSRIVREKEDVVVGVEEKEESTNVAKKSTPMPDVQRNSRGARPPPMQLSASALPGGLSDSPLSSAGTPRRTPRGSRPPPPMGKSPKSGAAQISASVGLNMRPLADRSAVTSEKPDELQLHVDPPAGGVRRMGDASSISEEKRAPRELPPSTAAAVTPATAQRAVADEPQVPKDAQASSASGIAETTWKDATPTKPAHAPPLATPSTSSTVASASASASGAGPTLPAAAAESVSESEPETVTKPARPTHPPGYGGLSANVDRGPKPEPVPLETTAAPPLSAAATLSTSSQAPPPAAQGSVPMSKVPKNAADLEEDVEGKAAPTHEKPTRAPPPGPSASRDAEPAASRAPPPGPQAKRASPPGPRANDTAPAKRALPPGPGGANRAPPPGPGAGAKRPPPPAAKRAPPPARAGGGGGRPPPPKANRPPPPGGALARAQSGRQSNV